MAMALHLQLAAAIWVVAIAGVIHILSSLPAAQASLPPVSCDGDAASGSGRCTVVNAFREWTDRKPCTFSRVHFPSSEEELVAAVAEAVRSNSKVRVVTRWSHSIPKLVCPAGSHGVLISTRDYNTTVRVDPEALTVTVDSGVMLQDLVDILAEQGMALVHMPYWSGLSIAGLLSTGAHGSSLWGKGSAVHEYLTSLRIVVPATADEGYATVKTFSGAHSKELAAAKVSLGVLGAISQVTLRVEPLFKRSLTYDTAGDGELESRVFQLGQEQEFGDVSWRPSQGQAVYRLDNRVPLTTSGDGAHDYITPLFAAPPQLLETEASRGKCGVAAALLARSVASGFGAANNRSSNVFEGYPVVGLANLMQATGSHGQQFAFYYNVAVSVPMSEIKAVLADLRELVRRRPQAFCELDLSGIGFLLRFVKGESSAHLGVAHDSADIDFLFGRADWPEAPRLDEDIFEEVEQILVFKYGGLPHWGKNRPVAFAGVAAKYPRIRDFLKVKEELDPQGFFSNEWTDAVLGIRGDVAQVRPFCALEGLCICSEDVHCAPEAGYFCRPGLVYEEARVCRFEEQDSKDEL